MGLEDIYVAYTYIYTHTHLWIFGIYTFYYITICIFTICFTLDKNYMPRIIWTLGVTKVKEKLTTTNAVITSEGDSIIAFCLWFCYFLIFRIYNSYIQIHARMKCHMDLGGSDYILCSPRASQGENQTPIFACTGRPWRN